MFTNFKRHKNGVYVCDISICVPTVRQVEVKYDKQFSLSMLVNFKSTQSVQFRKLE